MEQNGQQSSIQISDSMLLAGIDVYFSYSDILDEVSPHEIVSEIFLAMLKHYLLQNEGAQCVQLSIQDHLSGASGTLG